MAGAANLIRLREGKGNVIICINAPVSRLLAHIIIRELKILQINLKYEEIINFNLIFVVEFKVFLIKTATFCFGELHCLLDVI